MSERRKEFVLQSRVIVPPGMTGEQIMKQLLLAEMKLNETSELRFHFIMTSAPLILDDVKTEG